MKRKCKLFLICFLMAAAVLLEPVSYVLADETSNVSNDYLNGVPQLVSPEIEFTIKDFFDLFGLLKTPKENIFKEFVLCHGIQDDLDYSLYDLVCDFELKAMDDDGNIITSTYSYTIDFLYSDSWSSDRISVDDNLVYNYTTNIFNHEFIYKNIIKNADGYQERDLSGWWSNYCTFNTVISQADFYFVRKSDNEKGLACRFVFNWDSDFYLQKCVGISYFWYDLDSGTIKEIENKQDNNGIYASEEDVKSTLSVIAGFIADLPAVLVALVVGFARIIVHISGLFSAVFPFIPPIVFYIFGCIIFITILIAVYKIVASLL